MTKGSIQSGLMIGAFAGAALLTATAATVVTGDLNIQAAGLNVTMGARTETGFVVNIDGIDCPGSDCPAFALNWTLNRNS
ncbi:hypothetical protein [Ponticaulis sp.]|uniref:hypothetical protein n=1 Tax=Ponticaulis sp. TaxID=2020902 RepID=UPI0025F1037B|nr:hypothetical protein [Ponticaulis sp.]